MAECCDPDAYDDVFDSKFASRVSRRYRRRGLSRPARAIVSFLTDQGVEGATVLEIGGGVGEIHVELLRRGASRATNLEISTSYEDEAASLLESAGLRGRVDRRFLDVAQEPEAVERADIVVLHRVVCCYPDHAKLLGAAVSRAGRVLVFSHPPRNVVTRGALWLENQGRKSRGETFRSFAHPPAEMMAVLTRAGMRDTYRWRGFGWRVVGLEASEHGGE